MNKFISNVTVGVTSLASGLVKKVKPVLTNRRFMMVAVLLLVCTVSIMADPSTVGDYKAGRDAITSVTTEIGNYIPIVTKLCYAIAGVVAIVGAISVYISMNNEEQDVKNILVLQNAFEKTRKQMKVNALSINALSDNLSFPMFAKLTLKKT